MENWPALSVPDPCYPDRRLCPDSIGGVVRITESGLGCPDWPLCHGRIIPPFDAATLIEYSHRLMASVVGLLVLATLVVGLAPLSLPGMDLPPRPLRSCDGHRTECAGRRRGVDGAVLYRCHGPHGNGAGPSRMFRAGAPRRLARSFSGGPSA